MNKKDILMILGSIGLVTTCVLTDRSAKKSESIIESEYGYSFEEPTWKDKIRLTWKEYIPPVLSGIATLSCFWGANGLNKKDQAMLASGYGLAEKYISKYKDELSKAQKEETLDDDDELKLFLDFNSLGYFHARLGDVIQKATMDDGLECYIITMPESDVRENYSHFNGKQ